MPYIVKGRRNLLEKNLVLLSESIGTNLDLLETSMTLLGTHLLAVSSQCPLLTISLTEVLNRSPIVGTSAFYTKELIQDLDGMIPVAGDYNYIFTFLAHQWIKAAGNSQKPLAYANMNDVVGSIQIVKENLQGQIRRYAVDKKANRRLIGMITCMMQELYCSVIFPYEVQARKKNGPVTDLG